MIYAATIFLSSLLLFLVQPLVARLILPWFGGTAAVWTTCMLFFQAGLYSDMGLQVVYFALSVYGWYEWLYGGKGHTALKVSNTPRRLWPMLSAIAVAIWVLLGAISLLNGELSRLWDGAVGALIFSGLLFVLAFIYPAGMGFGDVKLALVLGTFLGYEGGIGLVLTGMFFSFAVGAIAPLLPWFFGSGNAAVIASVIIGVVAAATVGALIAYFAARSYLRAIVRQVLIAGFAAQSVAALEPEDDIPR